MVSIERPYVSYISAEFLLFLKGPLPFTQQKTFRLHGELSSLSVLGNQEDYPESRILIFTHPGSRISDPGSWIPDLGSRGQNGTGSRTLASKKGFLLFKGQVTF